MAKDYFFPPELSTPWAKVAEQNPVLQKAYADNPISVVMQGIGEVIQKGIPKVSNESASFVRNFNIWQIWLHGQDSSVVAMMTLRGMAE